MVKTTLKSNFRFTEKSWEQDLAVWKSQVYDLLPVVDLRCKVTDGYVRAEIDVSGNSKEELERLCSSFLKFIHGCSNLRVVTIGYSLTDLYGKGKGQSKQEGTQ